MFRSSDFSRGKAESVTHRCTAHMNTLDSFASSLKVFIWKILLLKMMITYSNGDFIAQNELYL
jgi:hypothetical protein